MYNISFYVPEDHLDQVKDAMFVAGAGKIGNYACCAWQCLGEGQFMPLDESNAYIGVKHKLEKVSEFKVEMVCNDAVILNVVKALRQAHPYEEPAFQVIRCEEF